jgi:inner membrane protein YhjD
MDLLAPVRAFDRQQQRRAWLAIPFAVIKKYSDDKSGNLAALIAYYAFFSLFPLLLVFVTILGFVLHGDAHAQQSVENSVLGQFPIIGSRIKNHSLHGSTPVLVLGVLASLWAGLGVTNAAHQAFDRVWAVPLKDRPDFFMTRLRGLLLLLVLGSLSVVASLASGLVSGGLGGVALKIVGIAVSLALNLVLFLAAFRFLTSATVATRCLLTGAVVAAVFWEILQIVGGIYIGHVIKGASATGGLFALVLGLLAWLHLAATATLYAAEINVVLQRHLWPRSLFSPQLPSDERTLTDLAKVEERTDEEHIDVHFERPA